LSITLYLDFFFALMLNCSTTDSRVQAHFIHLFQTGRCLGIWRLIIKQDCLWYIVLSTLCSTSTTIIFNCWVAWLSNFGMAFVLFRTLKLHSWVTHCLITCYIRHTNTHVSNCWPFFLGKFVDKGFELSAGWSHASRVLVILAVFTQLIELTLFRVVHVSNFIILFGH
jgi:hypothetical protein